MFVSLDYYLLHVFNKVSNVLSFNHVTVALSTSQSCIGVMGPKVSCLFGGCLGVVDKFIILVVLKTEKRKIKEKGKTILFYTVKVM
jgi:hypothetical protein